MLSVASLLSGGPVEGHVNAADEPVEMSLSVTGTNTPAVLGFWVQATDSSLDPAVAKLRHDNPAKTPVSSSTVMLSRPDQAHGTESLLLIGLNPGDYLLEIGADHGTVGGFQLDVFLTGDLNADGNVTEHELLLVSAGAVQTSGNHNPFTERFYLSRGIDLREDLYHEHFDSNFNRRIDQVDVDLARANRGVPTVTIDLLTDQDAPEATLALAVDSGSSATDGVTNQLDVNIDVTDASRIHSVTASIDGGAYQELLTAGQVDSISTFQHSLSQAELEAMAGTGLANNGPHTLSVITQDELDNVLAPPAELTFELDTQAPAAPTGLDLTDASDTGSSNSDNITQLTSLTLGMNTEAGATITLYSDLDGLVGQGTGATPMSIDTSTLSEGTHNLTVQVTDPAGNAGPVAGPISVTIDTTAPPAFLFDLDPASDTAPDGDHLTEVALVTFQGTVEPGATVQLSGNSTTADATTGAFSFANINLPFGSTDFTVVVTDVAGNSVSRTESFTRNNAPNVADQTFNVDENSANGTVVGTLAATDANIGEGDSLTYTITSGSGSGVFSINAATGQITVADSSALDFETTPQFTLGVQVTDEGGLADTATVTIDLNDTNDPPNIANQTFYVDENSANGTAVGVVTATDPESDSFTFAITGGNTGGAFTIDTNSGQVTVTNSTMLDFETTPSFDLTVQVTDTNTLSQTATVTINLDNVNEGPTINDQTLPNLSDSSSNGTSVAFLVATDPEGNSIQFSIIGGNTGGAFDVVTGTGEVVVANAAALDFGTTPTFLLNVQVNDPGGLTDTATVTINLTDSPNQAPVVENPIADINLTDGDPQPGDIDLDNVFSDPDGNTLTYTFVQYAGEDSSNPVLITPVINGNILTITYTAYASNQDRTPAEVTIRATDPGGLSVNDVFTVTVQPQYSASLHMVALATPTGTASASGGLTAPPTSITSVTVGDTYYLELWGTDTLAVSGGLTAAAVDVHYSPTLSEIDPTDLDFDGRPDAFVYTGRFSAYTTGSIVTDAGSNPTGTVDLFGGSTLNPNVALAPTYNRIGYIAIQATTTGNQVISIDLPEGSRQGAAGIIGSIDPNQFSLSGDLTIAITSPLHGTAAQDDTGIFMSLVQTPTALDNDGQVAELPANEAWIDEWDSYWVEIWGHATDGGVTAGKVDLTYNSDYFTATQIEHGPACTADLSGSIDDAAGRVANLGGKLGAPGGDGFVLLSRIKFESLSGDQVPANMSGGSLDLGLALGHAELEVDGVDVPDVALGNSPKTALWPVGYDVDDNDQINFGDLAYFASAFGENVDNSDSALAWSLDFDRSGGVDFGDLAFFAGNFLGEKEAGIDVRFPDNFTQRWVGTELDVQGDTSVDDVLDAALTTWQEALQLPEPIDVQLVIRDLGGSQLGEARILEVDDSGRPIRGRVTLDDDAAGLGWHTDLGSLVPDDRYDLFTTLSHEIGHVLGFTQSYAGFSANVQSAGNTTSFSAAGLNVPLDVAGEHLLWQSQSEGLMGGHLSPGDRWLPSALEANILNAAYDAVMGSEDAFTDDSAALYAEPGLEDIRHEATSLLDVTFAQWKDGLF